MSDLQPSTTDGARHTTYFGPAESTIPNHVLVTIQLSVPKSITDDRLDKIIALLTELLYQARQKQ